MSLNIFGWLRSQAKAAVLGGISDALAEVQADDKPADLDALRARLAAAAGDVKALPPKPEADAIEAAAAAESEPATAGRKARR
jgi:hypothetical protein